MTKPAPLIELQSPLSEALSSLDRNELIAVLTSVLGAYVLEGAPRFEGPTSGRALAALARLPFAQLVAELQMTCEQPELAALRVDGMNVLVRVGGQWVPLVPPAAVATPATPTAPVPQVASHPRTAAPPASAVLTAPTATSAPAAAPPQSSAPAVASPVAPGEGAGPAEADRFSLLELD